MRPLKQMNRRFSFNEVFISDARVPHANIVGPDVDRTHFAAHADELGDLPGNVARDDRRAR